MNLVIQAEAPPLRQDKSGAFRVGKSQVLLEIIIRAFQNGATPKTIFHRYPTATLADIYAVIAYYLNHQQDIEIYMESREQQAEEIREKIEKSQKDLSEIRKIFQAQRGA